MQDTMVAFRYAKSLLTLAVEQNQLEEVNKDMLLFAKVSDENPQFVRILKSPVISHDKKKAILNSIFSGKVGKMTSAFIDLSAKKGREGYLPQIAEAFSEQYKVLKGIQVAEVVSAAEISASQKEELHNLVKRLSGKTLVELKEKVDHSLIGGFILNVDDQQIDHSIKGKIANLKKKFKENPYISKY
jgi:F-type H+-transporting ATPase subunit delta